eukprot:scaffold3333_cov105-Pinguiococcus_pyrenoidosus.AAC.1
MQGMLLEVSLYATLYYFLISSFNIDHTENGANIACLTSYIPGLDLVNNPGIYETRSIKSSLGSCSLYFCYLTLESVPRKADSAALCSTNSLTSMPSHISSAQGNAAESGKSACSVNAKSLSFKGYR